MLSKLAHPNDRDRILLSKFVTSRLKQNPVSDYSLVPGSSNSFRVIVQTTKAHGPSSETQFLQVLKMTPRILENQCNSVIFLLQHAIFFIRRVRIHGSLSCDRLSWHSSQKFAVESAKIMI
jgi:hypothetical protein